MKFQNFKVSMYPTPHVLWHRYTLASYVSDSLSTMSPTLPGPQYCHILNFLWSNVPNIHIRINTCCQAPKFKGSPVPQVLLSLGPVISVFHFPKPLFSWEPEACSQEAGVYPSLYHTRDWSIVSRRVETDNHSHSLPGLQSLNRNWFWVGCSQCS